MIDMLNNEGSKLQVADQDARQERQNLASSIELLLSPPSLPLPLCHQPDLDSFASHDMALHFY